MRRSISEGSIEAVLCVIVLVSIALAYSGLVSAATKLPAHEGAVVQQVVDEAGIEATHRQMNRELGLPDDTPWEITIKEYFGRDRVIRGRRKL